MLCGFNQLNLSPQLYTRGLNDILGARGGFQAARPAKESSELRPKAVPVKGSGLRFGFE